MSEEYDLSKSEKGIGQLYPILEAKDGEIIDGFHREKADKNWKRVRLEHIDTEEKKLLARLIANFHRRQICWKEKEEWINSLAEIYKKQGLKIEPINEIEAKISNLTGLGGRTIRLYLHEEFKRISEASITHPARVPATQVIETHFENIREGYGKQLVERHREEVLAEEKPKIEREVKQKLLRSPEFQHEVLKEISKSKISKEVCPVLPPLTPDSDVEPLPATEKDTISITCPRCGYKFEW